MVDSFCQEEEGYDLAMKSCQAAYDNLQGVALLVCCMHVFQSVTGGIFSWIVCVCVFLMM